MAFDYLDSDSSYDDDDGPPPDHSTTSRDTMNLRNTSRLKRPVRYRDDLEPVGPGRPIWVHPDPVFNMDRASFVQWRSLALDEPSPGEAQYKMWEEQGKPRDAFGKPVTSLSPLSHGQVPVAESPGPTVAHLRRKSTTVRPDLSQPVADTIEQRDAFDDAFEGNLAGFEDDSEPQSDGDNESLVIHPQLSSEYQDWAVLSENVQWAIIYDLANDHKDGIIAAANLLSLTLHEVVEFINVYVREKTLWENGAYQEESACPVGALFQCDGEQDEVDHRVLEPEADQHMQSHEPDRRDIGSGALTTMNDAAADAPSLEEVRDIWHESEAEPFLETDNQVAVDKLVGQMGAENPADQPSIREDDEQSAPVVCPPSMELVTDSFSREDIASGRSFLAFLGLQEYADRFGQWFGRGTSFREIPGIFDENNEFIFSTEDTKKALYSGNELGWQGPVPRLEKSTAQREWLMEALPQDPARHQPVYSPLQQAQALAERINGRPINSFDKDGRFFDYVPEGAYGGLRYSERVQAGALAEILADDKSDKKEAESLARNASEPGGRAASDVDRRANKPYGTENLTLQGTLGDFGDEGARLFNTSSAMQLCPYMPRFDNGIARRFLEIGHVDIDEGYHMRKSVPPSRPPTFPGLPPFLQPHEGIVQVAGKAVPPFASLGHNSEGTVSDRTSQAQTRDTSSAAPNPTASQSIKTSSNNDARSMAEDTQDARVTLGPVPGEAVNNAAQPDAQGTADSSRFSENGIEVETFPKCYSCFRVRARCNGGRPCNSCVTRNRKCKDVTKVDLDAFPDRAERVVQDKAKADAKAAQAEGRNTVRSTASTPITAVPAPAISKTSTSGVKRNHSSVTRNIPADEDDSDLDRFPPEEEDPKDGDYDSTPKKKRPKKGNTPASKKQTTRQAVPATSSPTKKRGPRGPYRKKVGTPTPKHIEPVAGTASPSTPQPGGSAFAGNADTATPTRSTSAKAPAAVEEKSRNAGEDKLVEAGAGRSVKNAAKAVRHAGGEFGMTNVRPVPVAKRGEAPKLTETHSLLDPSLSSARPSGATDSRYLDISFAPVGPQTHPSTRRFALAQPMTPFSRPIGGFPDPALRVSPSWGPHPMPGAQSHLIPPRPQTISAENDHLSGVEFPRTASDLEARMAVHEMLPVTTDRMSLMPQIARPGLSGSPGATEISPTSQSSSSGTTVSMDFLRMPFSPAQQSPTYRQGSMSGGLPHSSSDYQSMSSFSPNFSAGMMPVNSPIATQRPLSIPSYHNGAHSSGTSVPSSMEADPGFVVSPGNMSPYAMFQQQRSIPRPISRPHEGPGYPVPRQAAHPSRPSGVFHDLQSEEIGPGSRGVSASPSRQQLNMGSPRPPKRRADPSLTTGQQPARKKSRASVSPLAPPREARSWKELARTQWATETQENQPPKAKSSVKPVFGGDGSYEVSFSQFTRIQEQIDPELQQTAMAAARKMNHSSTGASEKR